MNVNYRHIAIEGNIGAGKTTLAKKLSERLNARFVPEHFEDNSFLSPFYKDPIRYGFILELSFLEDRFSQMKEAYSKDEIFVSDYLWEKSLVFAKVNLKGEELRLFERIYNVMAEAMPVPDLVIYLHRGPDRLLGQISRRGRDFESKIPADYLTKVSAGYRDLFASENRMPVLWMSNDYGPDALASEVFNLLDKRYSMGLQLIP